MPFKTEHAARQTDPKRYKRFARKTLAPGITAVLGIRSDGSEVQSVRFDADRFTPAEARGWLKDHDFKAVLEEATGEETEKASVELFVLEKSDEKRYTLGIVYEPDSVDTQGEFAKAQDIERAAWEFMVRLQSLAKSASELLPAIVDAASRDDAIKIEVDIADLEEMVKAGGLDDQHQQLEESVGTIVESYVAPTNFYVGEEPVKKGTWLLGVVWTPEMFAKIKAGERTGLSMFGCADRALEV